MTKVLEGKIIFPNKIDYGQLVLNDEQIVDIILDRNNFSNPDLIINKDSFISPGFIDIQINGGFGKEFKSDEDALQIISENIFKYGTTSFCATIPTSPIDVFYNHSKDLVENFHYAGGAKFLGYHFEGPLLNSNRAGAHEPTQIISPNEINLNRYINDYLKIVTVSPEITGCSAIINELLEKKIKIGIGHSDATHDELISILDEENMVVIHLFNAMSQMNSRNPGIVGTAFANENIWVTLIADGIHIHPVSLKAFWNARVSKRRIICISDAVAVAGLEEGVYDIGERIMHRLNDRANLDNGKLVGSIFSLDKAIHNLILSCNCSLVEAVNTVTLNPATFLGIENEIGQIKIGNKADLVIINSVFEIEKTFINGIMMYETNS